MDLSDLLLRDMIFTFLYNCGDEDLHDFLDRAVSLAEIHRGRNTRDNFYVKKNGFIIEPSRI